MSKVDWNEFAKKGLLQAVIDPNDIKGFKNTLIDRIHWNALRDSISGSKSLLDFGCGTARFAQRIIKMGVKYTGIDSSLGMIEVAKHYNPQTELDLFHFDGINLPFLDNTFDACLSTHVMQYIINSPNTKNIFSELQRILVPRGRLILIEQVSLSNKTSGSVERVSTEIDYVNKMSDNFTIKRIERIRSCNFSRITNNLLHWAEYFPKFYNRIVWPLAKFETWRARSARENYLVNTDYYDIFIEAIKNGERN